MGSSPSKPNTSSNATTATTSKGKSRTKELPSYQELDFTPVVETDPVDTSTNFKVKHASKNGTAKQGTTKHVAAKHGTKHGAKHAASNGRPVTRAQSATPKPPQVRIPASISGYPPPQAPEFILDDIRPPISWYKAPEEESDEFNWREVETDITDHDEVRLMTAAPKVPATPKVSTITPGSVLRNAARKNSTRNLISSSGMSTPFGSRGLTGRTGTAASRRSRRPNTSMSISIRGIPRRIDPKKGSLTFTTIDDHARNAITDHVSSFTMLVDYLKMPIRFHRYCEIMTVRALVVWLASRKMNKSASIKPEESTPQGLLQLIAHGMITYASAYTILCRSAAIPCVLIDGIARRMEMDDGTEDELPYVADTWTAVFVENDWQLVHPYWICKGWHGQGASLEAWMEREIQNDGPDRMNVMRRLKLKVSNFINEDYFMPAPDVFQHTNYADNIRWQLQLPVHTVQSRDDFLSLPFLFPAFYRLEFKLLTEQCCVLNSKDGKVVIWMSQGSGDAHRMTLQCELNLLETKCKNPNFLVPDLDRLVLHCRHNDLFYVEIRFPVEGIFRLDISGGYHNSHSLRLCQFKLVCSQRMHDFKFIPYLPDNLMWGPGPVCDEFGLSLPSKPTGIVKVYQLTTKPKTSRLTTASPVTQTTKPKPPAYKQRQFNFLMHADKSKFVEYSVALLSFTPNDTSRDATPLDDIGQLVDRTKQKLGKKGESTENQNEKMDYAFCVECYTLRHKRQLVVNVNIPHDGEFALIIKAVRFTTKADRKTNIYGKEEVVCAYLLRTFDENFRENVHQKLARAELQTVMRKLNPEHVFEALEKCNKVKIDANDDELTAGRTRAEFLALRKGIFDAIHRRNFNVVNEQLVKISKYRHKSALVEETRRLFTLRKQLRRLLVFPTYVPELRRAGDELIYMSDPDPEIHITMGALYLLMEEPERAIESWSYIVKQLSNESIYKKMIRVVEMLPTRHLQRKVMTLLAEFNFESVKQKSMAAAKFYIWIQKVMGVFQDLDYEDPEAEISGRPSNVKEESSAALKYPLGANRPPVNRPAIQPRSPPLKRTDTSHEVNVLKEEHLKLDDVAEPPDSTRDQVDEPDDNIATKSDLDRRNNNITLV